MGTVFEFDGLGGTGADSPVTVVERTGTTGAVGATLAAGKEVLAGGVAPGIMVPAADACVGPLGKPSAPELARIC